MWTELLLATTIICALGWLTCFVGSMVITEECEKFDKLQREIITKEILFKGEKQNCELCKAKEIYESLKWENIDNCIGFDKETEEITIDEESLMRFIQLANPVQPDRKIKLINMRDEIGNIKKETAEASEIIKELIKQIKIEETRNKRLCGRYYL